VSAYQIQFGTGAQLEDREYLSPPEYRDAMQLLKGCGYTHVEYPHLAHLSAEEACEVRNYTRELGLVPFDTHSKVLTAESPDAHRQYRKDRAICCRNAEILGVKIIVDHVAAGGQPEDIARDAGRLRESAQTAGDHGLELAVENLPDQTPEYAARVADEIGLPNVGCCCDTGHALLAGVAPELGIRQMGHRLRVTHIQDTFGIRDDHFPPGIGSIDWMEVVKALLEIGFDRPWMLEISGAKPHRDSPDLKDIGLEKALRLGISYLSHIAGSVHN